MWLDVDKQQTAESSEREATVLVHHDGAIPDHHIILDLQTVFEMSDEMAEYITWVARAAGVAPVVTCPRTRAERLVDNARAAAQMFGYPLVFGLEQEVCRPEKDSQDTALKFAVSSLILCFALFSILCVSILHAP